MANNAVTGSSSEKKENDFKSSKKTPPEKTTNFKEHLTPNRGNEEKGGVENGERVKRMARVGKKKKGMIQGVMRQANKERPERRGKQRKGEKYRRDKTGLKRLPLPRRA